MRVSKLFTNWYTASIYKSKHMENRTLTPMDLQKIRSKACMAQLINLLWWETIYSQISLGQSIWDGIRF